MPFARCLLFLFVSACATTGGGSFQANPLLVTEPEQPTTPVMRAVEAVVRKDLDTAQQHLSRALADEPTDARALFVQACVFLERGSLKEAAGMVKRLREVAPTSLEGPVLEALTERRGTHPTEDWRDAFVWAWEEAGRPAFEDRGLFSGMAVWDKIKASMAGAWARTDRVEVRLMLALAGVDLDKESRRWLLAHLEDIQDPGLLLAALAYFPKDIHPVEPREALRSRLRRFADEEPTEMQRALLLLVDPHAPDAPFTEEELRELERIVALPDYRSTSTVSLYAEAERLLRSAGVEQPAGGSFSALVQELGTHGPFLLLQVVDASAGTLSTDHRMRLGRALWSLGERMAAESTLIERMLGLNCRRKGAALLADSERLARATMDLEEGRAVWLAARRLELDAWPLPSLQEAMLAATLKDEWTHLRAFVAP
ncbi:tetratricopeptide repeat protein [Corallococcus terminator]